MPLILEYVPVGPPSASSARRIASAALSSGIVCVPPCRLRPDFMERIFCTDFVPRPAFEAFDDFSDFVESPSCEFSESCQVRSPVGSNPCWDRPGPPVCRPGGAFSQDARSPLVLVACQNDNSMNPPNRPPNRAGVNDQGSERSALSGWAGNAPTLLSDVRCTAGFPV